MYKRIIGLETWLSMSLLVAMFMLVILQVISRYVFSSPLPWTEELARYVMIWMIFVASAHLTSTGEHIVITLIDKVLPPAGVKAVIVLSYLIVAVACFFLLAPGWKFVSRMFRASSPAMSLPMGWVYLAALSGICLIMLQSLVNMFLVVRGDIREGVPLDDTESTLPDASSNVPNVTGIPGAPNAPGMRKAQYVTNEGDE